jgi:hypothetical protein
MQTIVRVELEPAAGGECGCGCRAVSVTIDGVEKKVVETYNSVPTAAELPKEEEEKKEDYAEEEKETQP